jgi:hypothetical protein
MRKQKATTPIVIGSIVAIVAIGSLVYYYGNKCGEGDCAITQTAGSHISGWKKYSNDAFGYSLYYPETWTVTEKADGVTFALKESQGDTITIKEVSGDVVQDSSAKFGNIVYFYDAGTKTWKMTGNAMMNGKPIVKVFKKLLHHLQPYLIFLY